MAIQVTGILKDPLGNVSADTLIRVVAYTSEGDTVKDLVGKVITTATGAYNFTLVNGTHSIEVNFDKEYHLTGEVLVTGATPSPITLPALLGV